MQQRNKQTENKKINIRVKRQPDETLFLPRMVIVIYPWQSRSMHDLMWIIPHSFSVCVLFPFQE